MCSISILLFFNVQSHDINKPKNRRVSLKKRDFSSHCESKDPYSVFVFTKYKSTVCFFFQQACIWWMAKTSSTKRLLLNSDPGVTINRTNSSSKVRHEFNLKPDTETSYLTHSVNTILFPLHNVFVYEFSSYKTKNF